MHVQEMSDKCRVCVLFRTFEQSNNRMCGVRSSRSCLKAAEASLHNVNNAHQPFAQDKAEPFRKFCTRTLVSLQHGTSSCFRRYAKSYTGGVPAPPAPHEGMSGKPVQSPMMSPVHMGMPAMVSQPPGTVSDDGGSMHTAPMPLSDGCTNDDATQPHSTVSSDAGKSSLNKGAEHKVCRQLRH
jgi:hypothetical protein